MNYVKHNDTLLRSSTLITNQVLSLHLSLPNVSLDMARRDIPFGHKYGGNVLPENSAFQRNLNKPYRGFGTKTIIRNISQPL